MKTKINIILTIIIIALAIGSATYAQGPGGGLRSGYRSAGDDYGTIGGYGRSYLNQNSRNLWNGYNQNTWNRYGQDSRERGYERSYLNRNSRRQWDRYRRFPSDNGYGTRNGILDRYGNSNSNRYRRNLWSQEYREYR